MLRTYSFIHFSSRSPILLGEAIGDDLASQLLASPLIFFIFFFFVKDVCGRVLIWPGGIGSSATPCNELPQEEMRPYQPAKAEEEAQVETNREAGDMDWT